MDRTVDEAIVAVMPLTGSTLRRYQIVARAHELVPHRARATISTRISELAMGPHAKLERVDVGVYRRRIT